MGGKRGGRREGGRCPQFEEEEELGEMIEEREGRGKMIDSIYCGPTGCSRVTPVRLVTPRVQQVKLYR
jgi:hypothetical protein